MPTPIERYLHQVRLPDPVSHKGQNGKLLIIGGSELFHAASKWSLDVASKLVDMVFYSSIPSNNALIQEAKGEFWNGIVIPRREVENYLAEADCVLIGPGMERQENGKGKQVINRDLDTEKITNDLLKKFPHKKWVIDAGALQMADPKLFNERCIITPHAKELERVLENLGKNAQLTELLDTGVTILLKGHVDTIIYGGPRGGESGDGESGGGQLSVAGGQFSISGGNAGMTKGGTGDVLAGLVAGLYCSNDALTSAVVGSYVNKKAGELLYEKVGPFFNATDLVEAIPQVLWGGMR